MVSPDCLIDTPAGSDLTEQAVFGVISATSFVFPANFALIKTYFILISKYDCVSYDRAANLISSVQHK